MPRRVDLDSQLNAAAGFRRGFLSFLGRDLVLVIGLPLAGNLTVTELAGVLAHEFGHFSQGLGMRLNYLIGSVNRWFARVVFERDGWDVWLSEATEQSTEWWEALLFAIAQAGVWFSRLILHVLMFAGHGISCFMSRQMEYNADLYAIRLVGSEGFEETSQKLATLSLALEKTYKEVRVQWNTARQLPDNISTALRLAHQQLPARLVEKTHGELGLLRSGFFATHPSPAERIRQARRASEPGIFHDERPATVLFERFSVPARQVTILHYAEEIGLSVLPEMLVSSDPSEDPPPSDEMGGESPAIDVFHGLADLLLPIEFTVPAPSDDPAVTYDEIKKLDEQFNLLEPQLQTLAGDYRTARSARAAVLARRRLIDAGIVASIDHPRTEREYTEIIEALRQSLREVAEGYSRRLNLSLGLLAAIGSKAHEYYSEASRLEEEFNHYQGVSDELLVIREMRKLRDSIDQSAIGDLIDGELDRLEAGAGSQAQPPHPAGISTLRLRSGVTGDDRQMRRITRLEAETQARKGAYTKLLHKLWCAVESPVD